jgi:hypothetical protein
MEIITSKEEARGCGYRHSGKNGVGLYLMGDGIFTVCERLPFPLDVCPCCGQGTKFSRGFTWIEPAKMFGPNAKPRCEPFDGFVGKHNHAACFLCNPPDGEHGLMWVGEKFYTPASFLNEAVSRGISKRIASVPRDFKLGETVIYLAHKKAIPTEGESKAAVFTVYRPTRLDIVVDTTNPDELSNHAHALANRFGERARLVKVEPLYQQLNLLKEAE